MHGRDGIVAAFPDRCGGAFINYLAHLYLAGEAPADLAGALLGDFVKGPVGQQWPVAVADGIRLHRQIDKFTDAQPHWRASRARFPAHLRRFAGVSVDVVYDHFLARHWQRYHPRPLREFTRFAYAALAQFEPLFPLRLARIFPLMRADDWLAGYVRFQAAVDTLVQLSRRSDRLAPLAATGASAANAYDALERDFLRFFPDLVNFVAARQVCMQRGS